MQADAGDPMAIGIGLDGGENFHPPPCPLPQQFHIVADGVQVDLGPQRPRVAVAHDARLVRQSEPIASSGGRALSS